MSRYGAWKHLTDDELDAEKVEAIDRLADRALRIRAAYCGATGATYGRAEWRIMVLSAGPVQSAIYQTDPGDDDDHDARVIYRTRRWWRRFF